PPGRQEPDQHPLADHTPAPVGSPPDRSGPHADPSGQCGASHCHRPAWGGRVPLAAQAAPCPFGMKKRLLPVLLLLLLATVAWWLWKSNTGSTVSAPLPDATVADTASVDRIFIAEKNGGTADLRRTPAGWTVNGMPAKDFQVNLLLRTFKLVELRSPVPASMEPSVLRVMAGMARKVEIYQGGDKPSKIWWVGGSSADHYGTYMVLEIPGKGRSSVP